MLPDRACSTQGNATKGWYVEHTNPQSSTASCDTTKTTTVLPQRQHPTILRLSQPADVARQAQQRRPRRRANPQRTHSKPTANPQQCVWRIYEHLSIQIDLFEVAQFLSHFSRRDRRGIRHFQPICYDLFKFGFQLQ